MSESIPTTPAEAVTSIATLHDRYQLAKVALASAKDSLDAAAEAAAKTEIDACSAVASQLAASLTSEPISASRALTLIVAAAAGISPAQIKKIAEANRVSASEAGILLPAGRYEKMSRGRGWCRQGKGDAVTWGERTEGGYRVSAEGRWDVGCTDGFSRKDSVRWDVSRVGKFWIAN